MAKKSKIPAAVVENPAPKKPPGKKAKKAKATKAKATAKTPETKSKQSSEVKGRPGADGKCVAALHGAAYCYCPECEEGRRNP